MFFAYNELYKLKLPPSFVFLMASENFNNGDFPDLEKQFKCLKVIHYRKV